MYNTFGFLHLHHSDSARVCSNDFSRMVAEEYLSFFNFTGQSLDQALRWDMENTHSAIISIRAIYDKYIIDYTELNYGNLIDDVGKNEAFTFVLIIYGRNFHVNLI